MVTELTYLILVLRMVTQKLGVEKFIEENDFHLWKLEIRALLVHQGIKKVIRDAQSSKKINKIKHKNMQDAMDKAHSTIIVSLGQSWL